METIPVKTVDIAIEKTPSQQSNWFKPFIIGVGCFLILFFIFIGWMISFKKTSQKISSVSPIQTQQIASISGHIDFDGYASPEAYLAISERKVGKDTTFKDVVSGIVPSKGVLPWTWSGATAGTNYEIRTLLKARGIIIQESAPLVVSAPATDADMRLVSEQQPPTPVSASISGTIDLKGYIPPGSTVSILAKSLSANIFAVVAQAASSDNASWNWNNAMEGKTYDMKAQIQQNDGTIISSENPVIVTAPSSSQILKASSIAKPPAPVTVGISGTITVNGTIPPNSYLTLATRQSGASVFNQIASNIPITNNITWNWSNASAGISYDVQAYLWSNGKPYAQSPILTIVAPSTFEVLTINAQTPLPAPASTTFSVSCGSKQGGQFQANIAYNTQSNLPSPQQYNIVVYSGSQGGQVVNTTLSPANPTQSQSLTTTAVIQPGASYFAQYAYAQCTNCNTFSPMSPAIQFACQ